MTSMVETPVVQDERFFLTAVNCMRSNLAIRSRVLSKSREARKLSATRANLSRLVEEAARQDREEHLALMLQQLESQELAVLEADHRMFRKLHDALVQTYDKRRTTEILQAALIKKGKTSESGRFLRQGRAASRP